jgi:hypothetical protein
MIPRAGLLAALLGTALTSCASDAAPSALRDAISMNAQRIPLSSQDAKETSVGHLVYRGGLVLTSSDKRFGGWSGLRVSTDGQHMLSQSDESHLLKADLSYDKHGDLSGVTNAQLADLQDLDGKPMTGKEGDAEGLALLTPKGIDGPVAISFERNHRVWEYDISNGLDAKPTPVSMPDAIKALPFNSGLESLVPFRPDTLLAIGEVPDATGVHPAWLVSTPGPNSSLAGALGVKTHSPYEISDAALSPDGKYLYLLERHYYDPLRGIVIAVRRIDASQVKPGATLDGEEIASFTMRENIDNMEGISLRTGAHGETLLYIISDDNYNPIERTLLLMFEVQ